MFPLQKTGNGLLYSFNPITGKPSDEEALYGTVLPYQIKQATMLDLADEDFLKVVLLMDTDHKVCAWKKTSNNLLCGLYDLMVVGLTPSVSIHW